MEKTRRITFKRIPELTLEEQELLDSIKSGLKDIEEGRTISINEVKKRILESGKIGCI